VRLFIEQVLVVANMILSSDVYSSGFGTTACSICEGDLHDLTILTPKSFQESALGPAGSATSQLLQALSFLSSQWLIALAYSFLAAAVTLGFGISGFSSFPEATHQRPLAFKALVMSSFYDS